MIIFLDTFVRNNKLCTTYYVALSYIFAIMFIHVSTIFVSVVISHQEILYTCDRRGRFVYIYVHVNIWKVVRVSLVKSII